MSGQYFEREARQKAANTWDRFRVCLLGDARTAGERPSERVRQIRLANHTTDGDAAWPERCEEHAEALDAALEARAIVSRLGPMPAAKPIVAALDDEANRADLDLLFAELEAADLPLPNHRSSVPAAPAPAKPLLRRKQLQQVGKVLDLGDVASSLDPTSGHTLRMLLPEDQLQLCHFDGAGKARWRSVRCRTSPLKVPRDARVTLAPTAPGGTDLIRVRSRKTVDGDDTDGIYDAATGLMVIQPRYFDTQTHVDADGNARVLYAKMRGDKSLERVEYFRLLQSEPGQRPVKRRLKIPKTARLLLLPDQLLWWRADETKGLQLFAQPFTGKKKLLGKRQQLATLPPGSRLLHRCNDGNTTALLFAAGLEDRRYTLLFDNGKGFARAHDVGTIAGRVMMTCHGGKAMLMRIQHKRVSRWACDAKTCQLSLSDPLDMLDSPVHTLAPVGGDVAVIWKDKRGALRMRQASPDELASTPDTVVLDEWHHGGVEMAHLAVVSAGGIAIVLAQDVGRRVYALRLDDKGKPESVQVTR